MVILDNIMFNNGNEPNGEIKAIMLTQMETKGPDIFAFGGGTGSTIRDKNKYRTFGLDNYGTAQITETKDIPTMMTPSPVPRDPYPKKNWAS